MRGSEPAFSHSRGGVRAQALRHFFAVEQSGLHQSELTYAAVIGACGHCNQLDKAMEFFEEMKVLEMRRGLAVYEALIRACINCFRSDLAGMAAYSRSHIPFHTRMLNV